VPPVPPALRGRRFVSMAAMVFSSACVGGARGSLGSRRATCNTRFTHNRSIPRTARHPQGLKVFATVSKDNVFANNPGSLEALKNLTVDGVVRGPFTNQAPDDFSQMPHKERLKVFSGSAHPELSDEIANYLGMELSGRVIKKFADGEVYVQINESIRGCDVFLVQPTCPPNVNDNLMELLIMIDACRRASCRSITCVMPYFGYARADRRTSGRESIAAKLAANLLTEAGATRVVMLDIHSLQTIGYFDIPVDHIYGETVILDYLTSKDFDPNDLVVVSPDVGGVPRARAFAKKLCDAPLAIIDKRRTGHNKAEVMNLIGEVDGKVAIVLDDMIDTGGTICAGAKMLRERGAKEVYACATHAVFSPPAVERLGSGVFTEVIVTNSIPHTAERDFPQLTVLSVGNLLGETIWRVHNDTPVSFNKL
jgi:ribose-phosphate pyrophosphokinase